MKRSIILLFVILTAAFVSCQPERGPALSCFTMSVNPANAGQKVYFLNCSENYDRHVWSIDGVPFAGRHLDLSFPGPDTLDVQLSVWNFFNTDTSVSNQILYIN